MGSDAIPLANDANVHRPMKLLDHAPARLDGETRVALFRYDMSRGDSFGPHFHPEHQLSWAPTGLLVAEVANMQWELPPTHAIWIPGDTVHDVAAEQAALMYNAKFIDVSCGVDWSQPTAVRVTPLLAALLEHLARPEVEMAERRRAEAVLRDQLSPVPGPTMSIPMPRDDRALVIARALVADPRDGRSLEEWGRHVGASERTLVRLFADQTGMTFSGWRSRVRVRAAVRHLDAGVPIGVAAGLVGYRDVGAFIDAFRRIVGVTPGVYSGSSPRTTSWIG